jgi:hypothetical protein
MSSDRLEHIGSVIFRKACMIEHELFVYTQSQLVFEIEKHKFQCIFKIGSTIVLLCTAIERRNQPGKLTF